MKEGGFTLVELLGTIVILSLIVVVAFPSLINQLRDSNETIDESVIRLVEAAARDYVNDNIETYPKATENTVEYAPISVVELVSSGYLEASFLEKHCGIEDDQVKVSADDKKYIIEYEAAGDDNC